MRRLSSRKIGATARGLELAVAAFNDVLAFVAAEDPGRAGLVGRQVGQQRVPAVPGGFSVDRILVVVPGQDGFADWAGGAQVPSDAAFGGDRLDSGGHGLFGGVEPGSSGSGDTLARHVQQRPEVTPSYRAATTSRLVTSKARDTAKSRSCSLKQF